MKRYFKILGITFAIALIIVTVKDEYARLLLCNANYGMQAIISTESAQNDSTVDNGINLFMGSSMFRQGLDIHTLQEMYNTDSYILSYNGNQPFLEYYALKYLLEHKVKMNHLYMDMYAYSLEEEPWVHDEKVFMETNIPFKIDIWKEMRKSKGAGISDFWQMFVSSNNELLLTWPISYPLVNEMFYKGGNIITTGDTVNEQFATETVNARKADAFGRKVIITEQKFNNQQVAYLEKMIDLCKSNDIELTFIETPKYISVDHDDKYPGMMVQFVRILEKKQVKYLLSSETEKVLKENTNLQFKYMGETVFFEADNVDNFIDYVHLSTNGRKKYTQNLTESIKKEMSVEVKK